MEEECKALVVINNDNNDINNAIDVINDATFVPLDLPTWASTFENARQLAVHSARVFNKYTPFSNEVYGEANPELVSAIISKLRLKSEDVFVDIGSGIGNVVLQAAAQSGCQAHGIEVRPELHRIALKMKNILQNVDTLEGIMDTNVNFYLGDITDAKYEQLLVKCTVVYMHNTCFPAQLQEDLLKLFQKILLPGTRVVTLQDLAPRYRPNSKRASSDPMSIFKFPAKVYRSMPDAVDWRSKPIHYYFYLVRDKSLIEEDDKENPWASHDPVSSSPDSDTSLSSPSLSPSSSTVDADDSVVRSLSYPLSPIQESQFNKFIITPLKENPNTSKRTSVILNIINSLQDIVSTTHSTSTTTSYPTSPVATSNNNNNNNDNDTENEDNNNYNNNDNTKQTRKTKSTRTKTERVNQTAKARAAKLAKLARTKRAKNSKSSFSSKLSRKVHNESDYDSDSSSDLNTSKETKKRQNEDEKESSKKKARNTTTSSRVKKEKKEKKEKREKGVRIPKQFFVEMEVENYLDGATISNLSTENIMQTGAKRERKSTKFINIPSTKIPETSVYPEHTFETPTKHNNNSNNNTPKYKSPKTSDFSPPSSHHDPHTPNSQKSKNKHLHESPEIDTNKKTKTEKNNTPDTNQKKSSSPSPAKSSKKN